MKRYPVSVSPSSLLRESPGEEVIVVLFRAVAFEAAVNSSGLLSRSTCAIPGPDPITGHPVDPLISYITVMAASLSCGV